MLIQLDDVISGSLHDLSEPEWDALNNLAVASREGMHYLLAPRHLSELLAKNENLGRRERIVFKELYLRYSTLAVMATKVVRSVRVTRGLIPERVDSGGKCEIHIPLKMFSSSFSTQSSILLTENLSDGNLICELTRVFARQEGVGSARFSFEKRLGGGGTTSDVAEAVLTGESRLMVTIVDSDRKTPTGGIGSTAVSVRRLYRRVKPVNSELIILKGRELENLMPDEFFLNEFGAHLDHRDSIEFLLSLIGAGCEEARLHLDIKNGLIMKDVFVKEGVPADFSSVWGPLVDGVANNVIPGCHKSKKCAAAQRCSNPVGCECILMKPNGANILDRGTLAWKRNGRELWGKLPECIKPALLELCRATFDWGCASPRQSTT